MSDGGIVRVDGLEYNGPHGVPYFWDAAYQTASGATKETVGIWGGGSVDGDVVGCPIGDLVVVNPLLSRDFSCAPPPGGYVQTPLSHQLPNVGNPSVMRFEKSCPPDARQPIWLLNTLSTSL